MRINLAFLVGVFGLLIYASNIPSHMADISSKLPVNLPIHFAQVFVILIVFCGVATQCRYNALQIRYPELAGINGIIPEILCLGRRVNSSKAAETQGRVAGTLLDPGVQDGFVLLRGSGVQI